MKPLTRRTALALAGAGIIAPLTVVSADTGSELGRLIELHRIALVAWMAECDDSMAGEASRETAAAEQEPWTRYSRTAAPR